MDRIDQDLQILLRRILEAKSRRRLRLARLPIEEKIIILVKLQRLGNEVRRASGRPTLPEWTI